MELKCYTIGHSNHHLSRFIELLEMHNISLLIDVRSNPYSRYMSDYNKETIPGILSAHDINYAHLGEELGGRARDHTLMTDEGQTDYQKIMKTQLFKNGIKKVIKAIMAGERLALMCSEKNPLDCHRFVLVSRALSLKGVEVFHILETGELKGNEELENELLNQYKLNNKQATLFGERKTMADLIDEAYLMRGQEIAYKPEGSKA